MVCFAVAPGVEQVVPFGLQTPKVTTLGPWKKSSSGSVAGTVMLKTMVEALRTVATTLGSAGAMLLFRTPPWVEPVVFTIPATV